MATFDIPGSYLHTETDEQVIMFLVEAIADIMVKVSPKIYESMSSLLERGNRFNVSKQKKASYGLLWIALLFCKELLKYLNTYVFQIKA